jgi:hypothetical protein
MPDLRQGSATGKSVEDMAPAGALLLFGRARSLSSHSPNKLRQKFSIIQALFAEVYSKKARWWPSGDGMAYVS